MVIAIIIWALLVIAGFFLLGKFQDYCKYRKYERERRDYGDDSDEGHGAHFW